jgi:hypothetical protein
MTDPVRIMRMAGRIHSGFSLNGSYDKHGCWHRNKFCFVYCGPERCDCGPPMGMQYNPAFDESLHKVETAKDYKPTHGGYPG